MVIRRRRVWNSDIPVCLVHFKLFRGHVAAIANLQLHGSILSSSNVTRLRIVREVPPIATRMRRNPRSISLFFLAKKQTDRPQSPVARIMRTNLRNWSFHHVPHQLRTLQSFGTLLGISSSLAKCHARSIDRDRCLRFHPREVDFLLTFAEENCKISWRE